MDDIRRMEEETKKELDEVTELSILPNTAPLLQRGAIITLVKPVLFFIFISLSTSGSILLPP